MLSIFYLVLKDEKETRIRKHKKKCRKISAVLSIFLSNTHSLTIELYDDDAI